MRCIPLRSLRKFAIASCLALPLTACADAQGRKAGGEAPPTGNADVWPELASPPGAGLRVVVFARQQTLTAPGEALTDVISHLPASFGSTYVDADKVRWAHETSHGIHRHLVATENRTGRRAQGFYLMNDRAAVAAEPKIARADVAAFVPEVARGPKFQMFVGGGLGDQPLVLLDELTALCNGAAVAIEGAGAEGLTPAGLLPLKAELEALAEGLGYALALGRTVQAQDAAYFRTYPQFAELLAHETQRALTLLRAAPANLRTSTLLQRFDGLRTAPAAELTAFGSRLLGDTWAPLLTLPLPSDPAASAEPPPPAAVEAPASGDEDKDGVPDGQDKCKGTAAGATVWKYGEWIGCAAGQAQDD